MLDSEKERTSAKTEVRSASLKNVCRFILDIALLLVFSEYLLIFQFVACHTLDTYTHMTGDMHRNAAEIVGGFMTELLGEEMEPWRSSESGETAAST